MKWALDSYAVELRVGLDYNEEVHRSRVDNLGDWSNMIGYKMVSSPVGAYTMAKTSLVENFKHG